MNWRARTLVGSLFDTYPLILGVGLPALLLFYAAVRGLDENGYRYAGLAFQVAGLATVVVGIGKTRAEFGEGWYRASTRWLERTAVALGIKKPTPIEGSVAIAMGSATVQGEGGAALPPNATLEQRVTLLQQEMEGLRDRVRFSERALKEERQERVHAIEVEEDARQSADTKVSEFVKRLAMGGVDLSLLGALWLFFGIIFATIPAELAVCIRSHA